MGRQVVTRGVDFRYLLPSKFVEQLKKPAGVSAVLPDDKKMRLTVQGEKEAVELLVQLAQLADVKPLRYQLELTLVKQGPGSRRVVLESKSFLLENKGALSAILGQGSCELRGTLHGSPGEVQLSFEAQALRVRGGRKEVTESLQATRRVAFGKAVAIARFSDPATGPRRDKKPTPITLLLEATAHEAVGRPER
jgi:hypothetical protein